MKLSIFAVDDAERQRAFNSRVWLDGVEVTNDCQIAIVDEPDEAGAVLLLKRDAAGRHYHEFPGEPAREWRRGLVTIQPKDPVKP